MSKATSPKGETAKKAGLFDAAIQVLEEELWEQHATEDPFYDSLWAAKLFLEAGAKFTADDLERIGNTIDAFAEYTPIASYKCPGRVLKDKFIALLKTIPALPEPKGEKP